MCSPIPPIAKPAGTAKIKSDVGLVLEITILDITETANIICATLFNRFALIIFRLIGLVNVSFGWLSIVL